MAFTPLMGAQAAGGGIGAAGAIIGGLQQASAYEAQSEAAKNQAEFRQALAQENARRQAKSSERALSAMRAKFGAQGVDFTEGSALRVLEEEAVQGDLARREILATGKAEANQLRWQGDVFSNRAGQTYVATGFNAAGSLLGTASALESQRMTEDYRQRELGLLTGQPSRADEIHRQRMINSYTNGRSD